MDSDDLLRLSELLHLSAETIRLFSDTQKGSNGVISQAMAVSLTVQKAADDLAEIARDLARQR